MTCIIGLKHAGKIYVGSDGLGIRGWERFQDVRPKVFRNGAFIIGASGTARLSDLIRHGWDIPTDESGRYDERYMIRVFATGLRTLIQDNGGMGKYEERDNTGSWLIVGVNGQLYEMDSSMSIGVPSLGYSAVGSGGEYALGALAALKDTPPKERVLRALEIAAQFNAACGAPFTILED